MTRSTSANWRSPLDAAPVIQLGERDARGLAQAWGLPTSTSSRTEKEFRVRFRINGILYNVMALPLKLRDPLVLRRQVHG